jgi:hypothetical protein
MERLTARTHEVHSRTQGSASLLRARKMIPPLYYWDPPDQLSQQMILAAVTIGCSSNGRAASLISDLLAPAAQTSTGRTACSCLPWPAVLPCRPHRPTLLPPLAKPSLYSLTSPFILHRWQPHTAAEPVNPHTPIHVSIHYRVFPGFASFPS